MDGQRTKWLRNIAENFSRLSRVHECYKLTGSQVCMQNFLLEEASLATSMTSLAPKMLATCFSHHLLKHHSLKLLM